MFLSDKQVERLTRRKRPSAQARVLMQSGIEFRMVAGRPYIARNDAPVFAAA